MKYESLDEMSRFALVGITLPRTSNQQMTWSETNSIFVTEVSELKEGDFVFWSNLGHVGVVVQTSPDIKVIHATKNGGNLHDWYKEAMVLPEFV